MRKIFTGRSAWACVCLAALLLTVMLMPVALAAQNKPVRELRIVSLENPGDQNEGRLHATLSGGVLLLEYDASLSGTAKLLLRVANADGTPIVTGTQRLLYRDVPEDGLLAPEMANAPYDEENMQVTIRIDKTARSLTLTMEGEDAFYRSASLPVIWKPVTTQPASSASVWPSGPIALGVGQTVHITAVSTDPTTTDARLRLRTVGYEDLVALRGWSVEGIAPGRQMLSVENMRGETLATVEINVQQAPAQLPGPPPEEPTTNYRVLPRYANVYASADETQAPIGRLPCNGVYAVVRTEGGWLELSSGIYVMGKYMLPLR